MKVLLDKETPSTWDELATLPSAVGCSEVGTYFIMVDAEGAHRNHGYNGSTTSVGCGLGERVGRHLDHRHRERVRKAGQSSFIYNLLDSSDVSRSACPKQTGLYLELEDGSPSSIVEMRIACLLHEVMLQSWLKTFMEDKAGKTRQMLLELGPWTNLDVEWLPTNSSVPIKEQFIAPTTYTIIDPEIRRKAVVHSDHWKTTRAAWMEIEKPVRQMGELK